MKITVVILSVIKEASSLPNLQVYTEARTGRNGGPDISHPAFLEKSKLKVSGNMLINDTQNCISCLKKKKNYSEYPSEISKNGLKGLKVFKSCPCT
jgi:hypothetical protein